MALIICWSSSKKNFLEIFNAWRYVEQTNKNDDSDLMALLHLCTVFYGIINKQYIYDFYTLLIL